MGILSFTEPIGLIDLTTPTVPAVLLNHCSPFHTLQHVGILRLIGLCDRVPVGRFRGSHPEHGGLGDVSAEAEPHGEGGASGGAPGAMDRLVGLPALEVVTKGVLHL